MEIFRNTACLQSEQNYLHCCYKVVDKEITLGKITTYVNPYHKIDLDQALTFGHFTCVNDQKVFNLLMDAVKLEAIDNKINTLLGPIDGSTWNTYRMVTSPQPDPFLLEVISPQYHIDLFKNYGFETFASYLSTKSEQVVDNWDLIKAKYQQFIDKGVVFENFNLEQAEEIFSQLHLLCHEAFSENLLFSPIDKGEFIKKMMATIPLIIPDFTLLARHNGKIVGFIFCYPDLNDKEKKTIVVKTLARDSAQLYKGMGSVLSSLAMKRALAAGFTKGIHALMANFNSSTYISNSFKGKPLRNYELVRYKIEQ